MIPARFDYEVAESPEHALELLGSREDAKLIAGGHSLVPAMKLRVARPALLVDIGRLDGLAGVRDAGEQIAIGALTRHAALARDPLLQEHCPVVSHAAALIGDPQARHRGTIGGSLAHGDPPRDRCRRSCSRWGRRWSYGAQAASVSSRPRTSSAASSRRPSGRVSS